MDGPRLVLDLVWFVLHGWLLALAYLFAGLLACLHSYFRAGTTVGTGGTCPLSSCQRVPR